jgi:hypothetical protein
MSNPVPAMLSLCKNQIQVRNSLSFVVCAAKLVVVVL